jgi:acyl-coenzyme A synthetase/AMP-(fatty) acid ligase
MNDLCFYSYGQGITFDTFRQNVLAARAAIKKVPCNKVLLFNADSYQFSVWLFALIFEKKHVLLPPNAQVGTLSQFASQCDATAGSIVLTEKTQIPNTPNSDLTAITPKSYTREQFFNLFSGEITFYTSGSTGQAKAINKSCQQLRLEMDTLKSEFSTLFNNANTVVSTVSHQHIYGLLFKVLLPLLLGKVIINQTFEYPEHISRLLVELTPALNVNQAKSVLLISSPAHLQRLAIDNVLVPHAPNFSAIFSSGGLLSLVTSQALSQQMNIAPTEVYGSTETGGIAWRRGQSSSNEPWQVFPNIEPQVSLDGQRLEIFSPYVTEQPYLTDDKIELLDSSHFLLKGRIDRTVKIEEKRVNLNQIERHLVLHPWIVDARIIVINNRATNSRRILAAILVLTPDGQRCLQDKGKLFLSNSLKQHLLSDIERICLPKKWRYLTEFPYNSQGKLILNDLEKLFD